MQKLYILVAHSDTGMEPWGAYTDFQQALDECLRLNQTVCVEEGDDCYTLDVYEANTTLGMQTYACLPTLQS